MFADMGEIEHALAAQVGDAARQDQGPRLDASTTNGKRVSKIFDTTPGRLILGQLLPQTTSRFRSTSSTS